MRDEGAKEFFDELWRRGDPWELESSPFEAARLDFLAGLLAGGRFDRALEIGCGAGAFTRRLAPLCGHLLALDVASAAIERARGAGGVPDTVEYRAGDAFDLDLAAEAPWDLIVLSETVYYMGWRRSVFDLAWWASRLFQRTAPGGWLLLANTASGVEDPLMMPPLIRTYHDLFANVGYRLFEERTFRGEKHGAKIEMLAALFSRP